MIRRISLALGALLASILTGGFVVGRGVSRLLDAPRFAPNEGGLRASLDALGGEVVRLRSRDGLRLSARWLPAESVPASDGTNDAAAEATRDAAEPATEAAAGGPGGWLPDPHEAILLLHGYSGSVAPDLVEYGPFLRRTAGVLGLDLRGHGGSEDAETTFGMREVEDVAGALTWLGERGITRVALFGTSMGGMTALASVVVLGDGRLPSADLDVNAPVSPAPPPRPRLVAVVGDSVGPDIAGIVANRIRGPARRFVADRLLDAVASRLGADPRLTEPIRVAPLLESVQVLLIHGASDTTVPAGDARRLVEAFGRPVDTWTVAGAGHCSGHGLEPVEYESRVTTFLRHAFAEARSRTPIIPEATVPEASDVAS